MAQVALISFLDSGPIFEDLDWRQQLLTYLQDERLPSDLVQARQLKHHTA